MKEKYYIGGKQYILSESYLLCEYNTNNEKWDIFERLERLYRTPTGIFFLVRSGYFPSAPECEIITEKQAFKFMDRHPEGINAAVYDKVFGIPEKA